MPGSPWYVAPGSCPLSTSTTCHAPLVSCVGSLPASAARTPCLGSLRWALDRGLPLRGVRPPCPEGPSEAVLSTHGSQSPPVGESVRGMRAVGAPRRVSSGQRGASTLSPRVGSLSSSHGTVLDVKPMFAPARGPQDTAGWASERCVLSVTAQVLPGGFPTAGRLRRDLLGLSPQRPSPRLWFPSEDESGSMVSVCDTCT